MKKNAVSLQDDWVQYNACATLWEKEEYGIEMSKARPLAPTATRPTLTQVLEASYKTVLMSRKSGVVSYHNRNVPWLCSLPVCPSGSSNTWKETVLYRFTGGSDEGVPTAGLIFDAAGNLYGTTGGGNGACTETNTPLCGTAFELSHVSSSWKLTTLYTFTGGSDGAVPAGSLLFDGKGLFGTTVTGGHVNEEFGTDGDGTVFELTQTSSGWAENVIYEFGLTDNDGAFPSSGLIKDTAGNLYGTTAYGGPYTNDSNYGTIFELSPTSGDTWTETIVNNFDSTDGAFPSGGLILDSTGNLYGTTENGGSSSSLHNSCDCGTAYEITPK
jgi:uncharacterized repeat protein (TIGR03803 family)